MNNIIVDNKTIENMIYEVRGKQVMLDSDLARIYQCKNGTKSINLAAKEKIGSTNLLAFYIDRINTKKGINKYLKDVVNDEKIDEYADILIDYLDQFKPKFVEYIKEEHEKIEKFVINKNKEID